MKQHKPNCFEKTKVRWGIFKKLSPTKLHSEQSAPLAANYLVWTIKPNNNDIIIN